MSPIHCTSSSQTTMHTDTFLSQEQAHTQMLFKLDIIRKDLAAAGTPSSQPVSGPQPSDENKKNPTVITHQEIPSEKTSLLVFHIGNHIIPNTPPNTPRV